MIAMIAKEKLTLEFFNSSLVNATALVDQVAGLYVMSARCLLYSPPDRDHQAGEGGCSAYRSRLAGVDVADDHDIDMGLVLLTEVLLADCSRSRQIASGVEGRCARLRLQARK